MTELKEVLHLYLGCEVVFNGVEWTMWRISKYYCDLLGADGHSKNCIHRHEAKPILRHLSDMTEEEAIELAKLSEYEPHFRDVKVERNQYNDFIVTWQGAAEGREVFNATGEMFYCAEQFQYLLAKGFDLFNLIETGQAIDKSK